jgi:hypothetical protein
MAKIINTRFSNLSKRESCFCKGQVIHSYPLTCPLRNIVKDILYMQAQKGRAATSPNSFGLEALKEIFQNPNEFITSN